MSEPSVCITLVRHGESIANHSQRWQGQGDSPLSALGCAQAEAVAKRLAPRRFDRVIASDLERASATARALGRPFERDPRFRELDIGAWEGLTREQVAERFGDELARLRAGEEVAFGGGESYPAFAARVDHALAQLRAALEPGQRALVVCHGGVIAALVTGALALRGVRELPLASLINTSITELWYEPDGAARLRVYNDSLHLAELGLFPHPTEMVGCLALVSEQAPHAGFGGFEAHYDGEHGLSELVADAARGAPTLGALFRSVRSRHPACRVALSARAAHIRGWVGEALWREREVPPELALPAAGSLCHVGARDGRPVLIDYGVSV